MANSLFNALNGGGMPNMNNLSNFVQQLHAFQQTVQGDPRQQVQQLLNSGRINQQQFNQAAQMATQIQKMMGR